MPFSPSYVTVLSTWKQTTLQSLSPLKFKKLQSENTVRLVPPSFLQYPSVQRLLSSISSQIHHFPPNPYPTVSDLITPVGLVRIVGVDCNKHGVLYYYIFEIACFPASNASFPVQ